MGQEMKKEILILAGPSAVGKSTVAERILASGEFSLVRSFTTRERRGDGHDGEYFYVTDDTFSRMAEEGAFVEQSEIAGHRYGTPPLGDRAHRRGREKVASDPRSKRRALFP